MNIKHAFAFVLSIAASTPLVQATTLHGAEQLQVLRSLAGVWEAQTKDGVMTDIFTTFNSGTYVLGEELMNGKQITTTVFYVVGSDLRADHYCDFGNQPRYAAKPSRDASTLDFEFRDVTDADINPVHFHSTTWHIADATHLVQDWYIEGGTKPASIVHMEFTKTR
jgi:hypothetical protein